MKRFIITTTPTIEGLKIERYIEVVNTNIVIGTNFFSDFAASFTDVFGGNSDTYQRKMDNMYNSAKKELISKAKDLGGNAIVGFRIDFDEISGKGKSMFMLSAIGTVCVVKSLETKEEFSTKITNVDSFSLSNEIMKNEIIVNLIDKILDVIPNRQWAYILEFPSFEIAKLLVDNRYYFASNEEENKIESLVSRLDWDDAVRIVYPNYVNERIEKDKYYDATGRYYEQETKDDVSSYYLKLIKSCKLFSPQQVLELIDKDINKALSLLECEKPSYSRNDLNTMLAICDKFDNLADLGQRTIGKTGVFSKEQEIWICINGHKNNSETEFCRVCELNIKGLSHGDIAVIEAFKKKTMTLSKIFDTSVS